MHAQIRRRQFEVTQERAGQNLRILLAAAVLPVRRAAALAAADLDADALRIAGPLGAVSCVPAVDVERQNLNRLALIHREVERNARVVPPGINPVALLPGGKRFGGVVDRHILHRLKPSRQLVAPVVVVVLNKRLHK